MALITWNEEYSVAIASIDNQHKVLFGLIDDFYENIKNSSSNENIQKLVIGMRKYTQTHFAMEEKFMKDFNYPDYENHKKEHETFVSKVVEIEDKLHANKLVISLGVTAFIKDWLKNHIQEEDKKYSETFIKNGVE